MERKRQSDISLYYPLMLLALSFILYWPALKIFFSLDDYRFLLRAAGLEEYPGGISRLISIRLFFAAAWRLFGTNPWAYHLVVIIIHAANAWLVYLVSGRAGLNRDAAIAASLLFLAARAAFLPTHWASGIQEVSVTFFALMAAFYFFGTGTRSLAAAFTAAVLSILCKESSFLLLPALALVIPGPNKRRYILGVGGLIIGVFLLASAGRFTPRPSGDPYESAFGLNLIWNFLTYNAWFIRFWDHLPDRIPRYQQPLAGWGLIFPGFLVFAAIFLRRSRASILRASLIFICLLAPVLPLLRHSYLYYLYLPLIPFWIIAGSWIGSISRRSIQVAVLLLFILNSVVNGIRHRGAEIDEGVLEDPILRYAEISERFIDRFEELDETGHKRYLFLARSRRTIGLAENGSPDSPYKLFEFTPEAKALLGGSALRLFYPDILEASFENISSPEYIRGWDNMHIFWIYGVDGMAYMGYGEEGRMEIVNAAMGSGRYATADR